MISTKYFLGRSIKMFFKIAFSGDRWSNNRWVILAVALSIALLLIPQPGNTKEKTSNNNRLPAAPDTGSPEGDFSAGGTRDNGIGNSICGVDNQQIVYLLGNRNREFTSSAYPTFWFYLPNTGNKVSQMKFVLTELETGKRIYERVIERTTSSGIMGIDLPKAKQYALSPKVNYAWSLQVNCAETESESEMALEGWITRLPSKSNLQAQLAATSEAEKHRVYLRHNLLYDALTQLAKYRIAKPNNIEIETAWNQLLATLGWQDLVAQNLVTRPSLMEICISSTRK